MARNIKRGFNRLFVVLTIGWAIYCLLVIPLQVKRQAMELYSKQLSICSSSHLVNETYQECAAFVEKTWGSGVDHAFGKFYGQYWSYVLLALTAIPVAVYGLCRTLGLVGLWIYRGYAT